MPAAVYSPFEARARERSDPVFALHVGDTWRPPFEGARAEDLKVDEIAGLHNYTDTQGLPPLVDALCEKLRARNGLACERDQLLVGAGATGVLACAVGSVVDPGDEVLILAPFWPLIRGIVQAFRGVPVEVPFYDRIFDLEEALAALEERISERTVALYVSTPSNPTGRVLPGDWLEAFAEFARRRDLWLLSDEVYEDYRWPPSAPWRFIPFRRPTAWRATASATWRRRASGPPRRERSPPIHFTARRPRGSGRRCARSRAGPGGSPNPARPTARSVPRPPRCCRQRPRESSCRTNFNKRSPRRLTPSARGSRST